MAKSNALSRPPTLGTVRSCRCCFGLRRTAPATLSSRPREQPCAERFFNETRHVHVDVQRVPGQRVSRGFDATFARAALEARSRPGTRRLGMVITPPPRSRKLISGIKARAHFVGVAMSASLPCLPGDGSVAESARPSALADVTLSPGRRLASTVERRRRGRRARARPHRNRRVYPQALLAPTLLAPNQHAARPATVAWHDAQLRKLLPDLQKDHQPKRCCPCGSAHERRRPGPHPNVLEAGRVFLARPARHRTHRRHLFA